MKVGLTGTGVAAGAVVAGLALLGVIVWANRRAIGEAVNPASPNNLASRASSALVSSVSGGAAAGGESSIGGAYARLREWLSGTDARIRAMKAGAPGAPATSAQPGQGAGPAPELAPELGDPNGILFGGGA